MIMPTKIVKPVDCLFSISSAILKIIQTQYISVDDLLEEVNKLYYKKITIDKLLLCLNFLYLIDKIEEDNETIKFKLNKS
jgi:hypothetical protein